MLGSVMHRILPIALALLVWLLGTHHSLAGDAEQPPVIGAFLQQHCVTCHGDQEPTGGVALHQLAEVANREGIAAEDAKLWQRVLAQVATGEMPPDGETRPSLASREAVIRWISTSLTRAGISPRIPSGPLPADGNLIDHERLFSGQHVGPPASPPRFWRRSQQQYDAVMERLWVIPKLRYEKAHQRNDPDWAAYSYSQPFPSLDPASFTNYSGSVHADDAVLRALMDAGGEIAVRLTSDDTAYAKELQPPHAVGIPSIRRGSQWEKFKKTRHVARLRLSHFSYKTDFRPSPNNKRRCKVFSSCSCAGLLNLTKPSGTTGCSIGV